MPIYIDAATTIGKRTSEPFPMLSKLKMEFFDLLGQGGPCAIEKINEFSQRLAANRASQTGLLIVSTPSLSVVSRIVYEATHTQALR
jgi:hypothetical protein